MEGGVGCAFVCGGLWPRAQRVGVDEHLDNEERRRDLIGLRRAGAPRQQKGAPRKSTALERSQSAVGAQNVTQVVPLRSYLVSRYPVGILLNSAQRRETNPRCPKMVVL